MQLNQVTVHCCGRSYRFACLSDALLMVRVVVVDRCALDRSERIWANFERFLFFPELIFE
jgi:hypothetical protein